MTDTNTPPTLTSGERAVIDQLAEAVYQAAWLSLDANPDLDSLTIGRVAGLVERAAREALAAEFLDPAGCDARTTEAALNAALANAPASADPWAIADAEVAEAAAAYAARLGVDLAEVRLDHRLDARGGRVGFRLSLADGDGRLCHGETRGCW